jgi:hypothetical protein
MTKVGHNDFLRVRQRIFKEGIAGKYPHEKIL